MVIVVQYLPMVLRPTSNCDCQWTLIEAQGKGMFEIMLFKVRELLVAELFDLKIHDISDM